ncbi:acetyl-CoA carboxylase biotin carboxylase subunit family protein [Lysinibacillus sp. 38-6]|uniref:ATP-grasp domain-containing protein n=1 Tax=Lysinibacillus sp. 38-6 TaxID=3385991 RepID=UPI00390895F7
MRKRIMVIDCSVNTLKKIKKLGLNVICIENKQKIHLKELLHAEDLYCEINYKDIPLLKKEVGYILNQFPVDAILSFSGDGQIAVVALQEEFQFNSYNQAEQIKLFKNKYNLRHLLNRNHFSFVNVKLIHSKEALIEFANENGFPFILKPCIGTDSTNIKKISTLKEVYDLLDREDPTAQIAEDYLEGGEISVETFSYRGKHIVIGITDNYMGQNFVAYGHSAPTTLKEDLLTKIERFVVDFLTLTGVVFGPCQIEIKITADGLKIIEAHSRPGGDHIVELHRLVSGIDSIQWTLDAIYTDDWQESYLKDKYPAAAIRLFSFQPYKKIGQLTTNENIIASLCHIQVEDGHKAEDSHRYIIAKGKNVEEALEHCNSVIQHLDSDYVKAGCDHFL